MTASSSDDKQSELKYGLLTSHAYSLLAVYNLILDETTK